MGGNAGAIASGAALLLALFVEAANERVELGPLVSGQDRADAIPAFLARSIILRPHLLVNGFKERAGVVEDLAELLLLAQLLLSK